MATDLSLEELRRRAEELIEALNRRDFDAIAALPFFDAETTEFDSALQLGTRQTYLGVEGLRTWAREVDETWDDFKVEFVRAEQVDGNRIVVELRNTGVAKASGIPLDIRTGQIWTWSDEGMAVRNDSFTDPREAFAAAGLEY